MTFVVLDLEATCWEKGTRPQLQETIEFGAVRIEGPELSIASEFARFVRPVQEPELSEFCTQLTSITQADVDAAEYFNIVFEEFDAWSAGARIVTWGAYDVGQLEYDCRRYGMKLPERFRDFINAKKDFAKAMEMKPCGMSRALELLEIPLAGTHHRGIDDARNIAKIVRVLVERGAISNE